MELKAEYKQTEVGVIPNEWDVCDIADIADVKTGPFGSTLHERDYVTDGTPIITVEHLSEFGVTHENLPMVSDHDRIRLSAYRLNKGDIVFSRVGSVDRNAIIRDTEEGWLFSGRLLRLRAIDHLSSSYLSHHFHSEPFKRRVREVAVGQTMASLNTRILSGVKIVLPPVAEQSAIAEALSNLDALLLALDRLIVKKRGLKQAAMQQLLTGVRRLPGFKRKWRPINIAQHSLLKARIGWQGLTTAEYLTSGTYLLVTGTDFANGRITWETCPFVDSSRYEQDRYIQLSLNDVLVTKDGTIGKVAFVDRLPGPATLNSGVFVIRPIDSAYHPKFLYYILTSSVFESFLEKLAAGSTISHLYQKDFISFEFCAPPEIEEQEAIAGALSDIDIELGALESRRKKARALKQAMMQELLTGRTRLVKPPSNVITEDFFRKSKSVEIPKPTTLSHNWQINEAVVIGVLALRFGDTKYPLSRKRRTKLAYFLHRFCEGFAEGYLKKAAGPYNPKVKYQGPEKIALKNGYVQEHHNGTYLGFIAGENSQKSLDYFSKWYDPKALDQLEHLHYETTENLGVLATVDMSANEIRQAGRQVNLEAVKDVIRSHPEWEAKLEKPAFSDISITKAIRRVSELFSQHG